MLNYINGKDIESKDKKPLSYLEISNNLERGAIQFHKAVLQTVSGWTQFVLDNSSTRVIEKTQSNLHTNALSAGFQFVEFKAPNGVRVKIEVDPYYDDPVRNKIMHPNGGPAFSYRYDIMDIGTMD